MSKKRNVKIQILRSIAIIAVVLIHTCPYGEWQVFFRPFVNHAVALFLFLSGYLTKSENTDWRGFYKRRICRVLIPYIFWTIINTLPNTNPKTYVYNFLTARSTYTLYYVFVYIQLILITPIMGKMEKSNYRWIMWIISPISSIIFKYIPLFTGIEYPSHVTWFYEVSCLGWFIFYYIGFILGNQFLKATFRYKPILILYFLSIGLQIFDGLLWLHMGSTNCGTQLKLTSYLTSTLFLIISYIFVNDSKINVNKNRILQTIGDYSFGIFLIHTFVIRILNHLQFYTYLPFIINSAIVLTISFIIVYSANRLLGERMGRWLGFA